MLSPYRIVKRITGSNSEMIDFANGDAKIAVHTSLENSTRLLIHTWYIRRYESQLQTDSNLHELAFLFSGQQLAFQYEQIRDYRNMIATQFRVLQSLKRHRRYYELLAFAENSLKSISGIEASGLLSRKRSATRYVLKALTDACWETNNYRRLTDMVARHSFKNGEQLPAGVAIKHCLSYIYLGEYDTASAVIEDIKKTIYSRSSEIWNNVSIAEANVLNFKGHYNDSLAILRIVEAHKSVLSPYALCRMYFCYASVYGKMGDKETGNKYTSLTRDWRKTVGLSMNTLPRSLRQSNRFSTDPCIRSASDW